MINCVKEVGLDTSTIQEKPVEGVFPSPPYIVTNPGSNNDFLLRDCFSDSELITVVDFINSYTAGVLGSHLRMLKRDMADILMIPADSEELGTTGLELGLFGREVGVYMPTNVEQIEEIQKKIRISYVGLSISPLDFNYEVVQWCKMNKVRIIGFNQFGGHISAPRNIDAFSVPFLLGFSATYADIMILSGRNLYTAWKDKNYVESLIGCEVGPQYILKKSIYKPVPSLNKAIYTMMNIENNISIGFESPESAYLDTITSLGPGLYTVGERHPDNSLESFLIGLDIPGDISDRDRFSIYRYKIMEKLEKNSKIEGCEIIGNSILIITTLVKGRKARFWKKRTPDLVKTMCILIPPAKEDIRVISLE